jgi:hypothetical protein
LCVNRKNQRDRCCQTEHRRSWDIQLRCMGLHRWRDYEVERARRRSLIMRMVVMLVARRNGGRPAGASVCRTCRNAMHLCKQYCRCDSHDQFRGRHAILRSRGYHEFLRWKTVQRSSARRGGCITVSVILPPSRARRKDGPAHHCPAWRSSGAIHGGCGKACWAVPRAILTRLKSMTSRGLLVEIGTGPHDPKRQYALA